MEAARDESTGRDGVPSSRRSAERSSENGRPLTSTSSLSPPASPPVSPPADERRSPANEDYYASRPKFDRLGNPIPDRRRPSAMASVYGSEKVRLPGDLGARDPRRPRSPAPSNLPGDLGPNDPRRPSSRAPSVAASDHARHASRDSSGRVAEDPEPEDLDSDNDADADNDNDTDDETRRGRGRKRPEPGKTTAGKAINVREDSEDSVAPERAPTDGTKPDPTKGQSLRSLSKEQRRSLSAGEVGKRRVHPSTAFDVPPSGVTTPMHSDDESHSELRAAQKLTLAMSGIHSTPSAHRVIRQIIRGDFEHFQRQAEEGRKRQRMYLVATDLSPEAEYALEWTIGTVLRDGDTLFAVYAADEELVGSTGEGGVEIGAGADSVKDTAAIVRGLVTNQQPPNSPGPSPLARSGAAGAAAGGVAALDARSTSRGLYSSAEAERRRATDDISERCVRLLRKTRLQVRVVVEVVHCKSPRHTITEVIDYLSPTLVIIGSRGRSAVKGVLLGSFSNYLVTKSSVPVMVARKRLRKHSKTTATRNRDGTAIPYQGTGRTGRFSNVIEAPKRKGLRVKGWDEVGID